MALPLEAISSRPQLFIVAESSQRDDWGQQQLLPELPWGGMKPVLDPDAYFRMQARDDFSQTQNTNYEVWRQSLLPSLPRGLVDPDEYHKEYLTQEGSAYYATSVNYDAETGSMLPYGRTTLVASGEIIDEQGETVELTTVQVGYENWEPVYLSVNRQNVKQLDTFFTDQAHSQELPPPLTEIFQFSGPFSEDKEAPVAAITDSAAAEYVYRKDNRLILERVDPKSILIHRVEIPYRLGTDLTTQLIEEGKSGQADDSDEAFLDATNPYLEYEDGTIFQVPQKYPVRFSTTPNHPVEG